MKHIFKQVFFFALLTGVLLSGCKKGYLDVNADPNRVTDANITPDLIFPAAALEAGQNMNGFRVFEHWVGYFSANMDFVRDANETSYNLDYSFGDTYFQTRFHRLYDLHQAEVKSRAVKDSALAGAAIVLSAKGFQELVDVFGNIPYSQAFQVGKTVAPVYDKGQDIYKALQLRLDTAITLLGGTPPPSFAKSDIINGGSTTKWIHFANALKLRLLIRQSQVAGFDPSADIAKILAKGGLPVAGENMAVNPGFSNDLGKQNPFYAAYGYTVNGAKATTSDNANLYIINLLKSTQDPRIGQFFLPVGKAFVGNRYGDEQGHLQPGTASSYFGPALIGGVSPAGASRDQWLLPAYESLFFQAEATARGWLPGSAQTAYTNALHESFVYLGVANPDSAVTAYVANNPSIAAYPTGASVAAQVNFVVYQKYLANTGIDPLESYSDIRRLNFLTDMSYISINAAALSKTLPLRLPYPQSEITTNGANVAAQGAINIFTSKIFWEP